MGDILKPFSELNYINQVYIQLKDIQLEKSIGFYLPKTNLVTNDPTYRTVNGLKYPSFSIDQNELQFWVIGNFGPNIYYNLSFGGNTVHELVRDVGLLNQLVPHKYYILGPGSRVGFLFQGPVISGFINFTTMHYDNGVDGDQYPEEDLAKIIISNKVVVPKKLPTSGFPKLIDYTKVNISNERYIVFSEKFKDNLFFINGKLYDPDRIDFKVKLGDIEKWTIYTDAPANHYFHIHQVDFQVVEFNNTKLPFVGYQDNCQLPFYANTTIIIPFTNPVIVGKFVMHCHIIGHEDRGMMSNIVVVN